MPLDHKINKINIKILKKIPNLAKLVLKYQSGNPVSDSGQMTL